MIFRAKKIVVPANTQEISAAVLYEVRWTSRYDAYHGCANPEVEIFFNEADANLFKQSLENAFKLIRTTHDNKVKIIQRKT